MLEESNRKPDKRNQICIIHPFADMVSVDDTRCSRTGDTNGMKDKFE